jgi:endo-1,4-beta-xylanase
VSLSRRNFLLNASTAAAAISLGLTGCAHRVSAASPSAAGLTIAKAGKRNGILAGAAVDVRALRDSPSYADLIRTQCSIVVAENEMKFGSMRPAPDRFFFEHADFLVDFALRNGILVRGHNFVWHRQLPAWFASYATPANAEHILIEHIERVGGRYAGRVHSWDVCNEAVHLEDGQAGGRRNSPWYKLLGPGYVDLAYRTARRVDPHALLCYNDYDIESEAPSHAAKRAAVLELLRGMKKRGVPIDAMGIQGHISAGPSHEYGPGLTRFMAEVQRMGLKLLISEMDVNDRALPPLEVLRDRDVAATYASFLKITLANTDIVALLTWGLTDKYTWLNGEDSRSDHLPERCLPFDATLHPVLAFDAEVQALLQAPSRALVLGRS